MKKSLFGYNVRQVDDTIRELAEKNAALIRHNDYMEDQVKNLQSRLDEAEASLAVGMTSSDKTDYKNLKIAYAALLERVRYYEEDERQRAAKSGGEQIQGNVISGSYSANEEVEAESPSSEERLEV